MPNLPEKKRRSWEVVKPPQSGRVFINPWYHTTRWRKLRKAVLMENPLCVECQKINVIELAKVVDHEIPVSSGHNEAERERLMWDLDNLQGLCDSCHNRKSAKERQKNINL